MEGSVGIRVEVAVNEGEGVLVGCSVGADVATFMGTAVDEGTGVADSVASVVGVGVLASL